MSCVAINCDLKCVVSVFRLIFTVKVGIPRPIADGLHDLRVCCGSDFIYRLAYFSLKTVQIVSNDELHDEANDFP